MNTNTSKIAGVDQTETTGRTKMKKIKAWMYGLLLLPALFLLLASVSPFRVPRTVEFDQSLPYMEINGYKYHIEVFGSPQSTPLIALHGGPGLDYEYLKTLKALSKDYRVIFYDQRGTGLSPRVGQPYPTVEQSAQDLRSIVEHFSNGGKVKLIGHSWGGALVVAYLSKYPTSVSQAMIVEPLFLDPAGAKAWAPKIKTFLPIWDIARYAIAYPFVYKEDGQESLDYVGTMIANRDLTGPPYLCEDQHLPPNMTTRFGYEAYNNMQAPIIDHPELFTTDLTAGLAEYHGDLMLIGSECSILGYAFQEQYNLPLLPPQTINVRAENTGHHVLTLNPEWSISIIQGFFKP
jgi:proline iminopeptidase